MKQKNLIAVLIIIIVILIGTTVYFATKNKADQSITPDTKTTQQSVLISVTTTQSTTQQVTTTTQPTNEVVSWKTYKNTKYGFELTFPDTWQGYQATYRTLDWGTAGTSDSIDFGFNGSSIFNISIHSKTNWQAIKSEMGPTPAYLGENGGYVFGYSVGNGVTDKGTLGGNRNDVGNIIKTFQFIK